MAGNNNAGSKMMDEHTEEELKKLTKADLIDHIMDIEHMLDHQHSYKDKFADLRSFFAAGITMGHHLLNAECRPSEGERLYALATLRAYKKAEIYAKSLLKK